MNERYLKYGKSLKILTMIMGIINLIAGLFLVFAKDYVIRIIRDGEFLMLDSDILSQLSDEFLESYLIYIGFITIIIAVLIIVAGMKSRYSYGWNMFLAIFFGIEFLINLLSNNFFDIILDVAIMILAILNLKECKRILSKEKDNYSNLIVDNNSNTGFNDYNYIEKKLNNLKQLYENGFITEEEYKTRREKILDELNKDDNKQ